jgi:hypothetical protein
VRIGKIDFLPTALTLLETHSVSRTVKYFIKRRN